MASFKRVLVFQTAFLGDAILATPLLKGLRRLYPAARIGFVCRAGVGELFTRAGVADEVIEVKKDSRESLKAAFAKTREFAPDLVVSPHRSFRTSLWVWRLKPAMAVGFKDRWSFFAYDKRVVRPDEKHDVLRQLSLLEALGADVASLPGDVKSVYMNIPEKPEYESLGRFVALSPGSQWETKRWTTEGYIELAHKFQEAGKKVAVLGAMNEKSLCAEIEKAVPGLLNMCGKTTVLQLAQLLKRAELLVCNDSGTMHVATAVGTPVTTIFGPTVPAQGYAPWSEKARIVQLEMSCRPCGAHGHRKCPIGTHDCMKKITALEVFKTARELRS